GQRPIPSGFGDHRWRPAQRGGETSTPLCGASGIEVVDADVGPEARDGSTNKREDLRIEFEGDTVLIDVAGREQHLRQPSLNQLGEHRRMFLAARQLPYERVHPILVANFNYGGGSDPRKRGEMFGSGTVAAVERMKAEGYTAVSCFDLFQIIRA